MTDSIARLSLLKSAAYVNEPGDTQDIQLKAVLTSASSIVSLYCGREFPLATYEEYYTGNDTTRLFVRNPPIVKIESVYLWNGTSAFELEDASYYHVIDKTFIKYPKLGQEANASWGSWTDDYEDGILIKYTGGYACADWENKEVKDAFGVPADLEHATCQVAMKIWYDSKAAGGRFGLSSLSRDGGVSFDKFFKGLPDETCLVLNQYRRNVI